MAAATVVSVQHVTPLDDRFLPRPGFVDVPFGGGFASEAEDEGHHRLTFGRGERKLGHPQTLVVSLVARGLVVEAPRHP
jgi:hypothetical protein